MKKRYLYSLLFGIPGLFIAGILSILAFGGLAGILWLYVFGDNPWPAYVEPLTSAFFILSVSAIWIAFIALGYTIGRRLEQDPILDRNHVLISAGLTVMFLLMIVFQQFGVGNLGPQSDSVLCSEFCVQHGYSGSGVPPQESGIRTCSCFDDNGHEAQIVPLESIQGDSLK